MQQKKEMDNLIPSHSKRVMHIALISLFLITFNFIFRLVLSLLVSFFDIIIFFFATLIVVFLLFLVIADRIEKTMNLQESNLSITQKVQVELYYGSLVVITLVVSYGICFDAVIESTSKEYYPILILTLLILFIPEIFIYIFALKVPDVYGTKTIIAKFNENIIHLVIVIVILLISGLVTSEIVLLTVQISRTVGIIEVLIFGFVGLISMVLISAGSYLLVVTISFVLLKLESTINETSNENTSILQ